MADKRKRDSLGRARCPVTGQVVPAEIDVEVMKRAASIGCTMGEIAVMLGIARSAFYRHLEKDPSLRDIIEEGLESGKTSLRRHQWQRAEAGSDTMLIWLGKQMLGQRDRLPDEIDPDRLPMRVVVELVGEPVAQARVEAQPQPRSNMRLINADVEFKG